MSSPTVVLDLDGTLLDEQPRHYGCYAAIMRELGRKALRARAYWALKRQAVDARGILGRTGAQEVVGPYQDRWMSLIESPEMLALDALHVGVAETLHAWVARGACLVLTSLRQRREGVDSQLRALGLESLFPRRAVASPSEKEPGKARAVRALLQNDEITKTVWVGDTEADLRAARLIGCPVWLVTCGIRSADFLRPMGPDRLSQSLAQVDPFDSTLAAARHSHCLPVRIGKP